jgi:hypothetical protein
MPTYFLHFRGEDGEVHDASGFVCDGPNSALRAALRAAGQMIAEDFARGDIPVSFELCLDDEAGQRLATLPVNASVAGL